jgi:hypothetical protein
MTAPTRLAWCERVNPALPFLLVAALAIVGGGALAAAMAHVPSRKVLWAVAYLVLVVGVTQAALGVGQALLATRTVSMPVRLAEWAMFNLGSAGVMGGTLCSSPLLVVTGTLLFAVSLALFLLATRGARSGWPILAYRALLVFIGGSAVVGVVLATVRTAL